MATYFPPTENINEFNSSFFVQNDTSTSLTQSQADQLYLSKVNTAVSIAPQTTFNGAVSVGGTLTGSSLIQSNTTSVTTNKLFDNLFAGSSLAIGTASTTNSISGTSTFNNNLTILAGATLLTNQISGVLSTGTKNLYATITGTLNIGQATTTLINIKGPTTFDIDTTFANRLNHSATSYSFPFASSQSLGYYFKNTQTGIALTSGITSTILTTSTIPIGVWRIDFSVQNAVGGTGAGTISQAQSYVSTTLNGNNTTAVPFTGSIIRSHTSEVYGNNDIQLITSSFTYNQTTAGVLYLNAFRVFATGTYVFTGELSITRIA